jgi:glutamate synthase (NADPH/NADH)
MAALDFDDRQTQIDAENQAYHPYEYQVEQNESWAGALPVKQ